MNINARIKAAREAQSLSVDYMVRETGISIAQYHRYERDSVPPLDKAAAISLALDVSLDYLAHGCCDPDNLDLFVQKFLELRGCAE